MNATSAKRKARRIPIIPNYLPVGIDKKKSKEKEKKLSEIEENYLFDIVNFQECLDGYNKAKAEINNLPLLAPRPQRLKSLKFNIKEFSIKQDERYAKCSVYEKINIPDIKHLESKYQDYIQIERDLTKRNEFLSNFDWFSLDKIREDIYKLFIENELNSLQNTKLSSEIHMEHCIITKMNHELQQATKYIESKIKSYTKSISKKTSLKSDSTFENKFIKDLNKIRNQNIFEKTNEIAQLTINFENDSRKEESNKYKLIKELIGKASQLDILDDIIIGKTISQERKIKMLSEIEHVENKIISKKQKLFKQNIQNKMNSYKKIYILENKDRIEEFETNICKKQSDIAYKKESLINKKLALVEIKEKIQKAKLDLEEKYNTLENLKNSIAITNLEIETEVGCAQYSLT